MNQTIFHSVNFNFIADKIKTAKKSVYLATPGITNTVADALIVCAENFRGWENITIVLDPSPKIYYLGYGENNALKKLESSSFFLYFKI